MSFFRTILVTGAAIVTLGTQAFAADRDKIEAFMEVTGFDQALYAMRTSASDAPGMLGLDADDFGLSWKMLADELFENEALKDDALEILEQALSDEVLAHAAEFYASDLGQRLVEAENESHFADDAMKSEKGAVLAAALIDRNSPQPQYFLDMAEDIGSVDNGIKAYREVQVRFLMAAMNAGIMSQRLSEEELREVLGKQDDDIRAAIKENMIASNAYTYRDFNDDDMLAYRDALRTPEMKEVYELMNGIQYAIMADRYEKMASRLAELHPSQEL